MCQSRATRGRAPSGPREAHLAWYKGSMFALNRGELAIVAFIFALVWSAVTLPRFVERVVATLTSKRARGPNEGP